jgi:hypothetical protein
MRAQREAELEVFADYHQFYLWDGGVDPQAPEDWSDEDVANRAKVAEHVFVVCPLRNTTVPVRVTLLNAEPALNLERYDHAVQASLALPTGQLQVHECTGGEVLAWKVKPGTYRVLALFSGLGSLSSDGLEVQDTYQVVLWPGSAVPLKVLKQWSEERDA